MATIILRVAKGSPLTTLDLDNNFSNINNELITKLPIASYTASDILTKLKTVDGIGSGLDADLLDGLISNTVLPTTANKSSIVSRDSVGNFTANLITGIVTTANALNGANTPGFISRIGPDLHSTRNITGDGADIVVANGDGISGNPTISAGANLTRINAVNTYTLPQNFAVITANALSNDGNSNLFTGVNNLSLTSTNGFVYVPMITGIPTGIPTANAGRSPVVWDATSNKLWVYSGGNWISLVSPSSSNLFTQRQIFTGNQPTGLANGAQNLGAIEIQGNGSGGAFMGFHRPGQYASYFGLDTDNQWKFGGFSAGAVANTILHTGNMANFKVGASSTADSVVSALGVGQTWQQVSRTFGFTYTNTTGKPIELLVHAVRNSASSSYVNININGLILPMTRGTNSSGGNEATGSIIIPINANYILTAPGEALSAVFTYELK